VKWMALLLNGARAVAMLKHSSKAIMLGASDVLAVAKWSNIDSVDYRSSKLW
jgi:hypothetical protein